MNDERIAALQATPMFGGISDGAVEFVLQRASEVAAAAGAHFFREGDAGTAAYLLERGRVRVTKSLHDTEHVLKWLEAGDCFGEVALLDFGPRSASVVADEDSRALQINARDLAELAGRDTEQFALIYMNLARELSRRLRDADARLFRAVHEDAEALNGYAFQTV